MDDNGRIRNAVVVVGMIGIVLMILFGGRIRKWIHDTADAQVESQMEELLR